MPRSVGKRHDGVAVVVPVYDKLGATQTTHEPRHCDAGQARRILEWKRKERVDWKVIKEHSLKLRWFTSICSFVLFCCQVLSFLNFARGFGFYVILCVMRELIHNHRYNVVQHFVITYDHTHTFQWAHTCIRMWDCNSILIKTIRSCRDWRITFVT